MAKNLTVWIILKQSLFQLLYFTVAKCEMGGGQCLSSAQYKCFNSSTQLIITNRKHPTDIYAICSDFDKYHKCMQSHISLCGITDQERQLYQIDMIDAFTKDPYRCQLSPSEWSHTGDATQVFGSYHQRLYTIVLLGYYMYFI